jgi:hypothetical protein
MTTQIDTHQRALAINLDSTIYGSFAEIGAGQEVAAWFFRVGGAAGTVARTICAYDMAMSDAVYGKCERYVSRERLVSMLEFEHALLLDQLGAPRGEKSRFFAFADTVSARNYAGTNECHGWIGLRFQHEPGSAPSDALFHVNLMDPTNLLQQEAVGILGVNLIHAAYHERGSPEQLLTSLFQDLSLARLEVDVAELRGPAFPGFDSASTALQLVRLALAQAVVFDASGVVTAPSEALRKRPLVVERGLYRTAKPQHGPLLAAASRYLRTEVPEKSREPLALFEMTVMPTGGGGVADGAELLLRIGRLTRAGFPVAVTRFGRAFELAEFLRRYTAEPVRLAMGTSSAVELLLTQSSAGVIGGALQALGRLLSDNVRLYVYPMPADVLRERLTKAGIDPLTIAQDATGTVTPRGLKLPSPIGHMLDYLLAAGWMVTLPEVAQSAEAGRNPTPATRPAPAR